MTQYRLRREWVEVPRVLTPTEAEAPITLENFAYESTGALLAVEPRLAQLALLVEGCARGGHLDEATWRAVDTFAATLVGQGRCVAQVTAVNSASRAVASDLRGPVIYRRYIQALRQLASDARTEAA